MIATRPRKKSTWTTFRRYAVIPGDDDGEINTGGDNRCGFFVNVLLGNWKWIPLAIIGAATMIFISTNTNPSRSSTIETDGTIVTMTRIHEQQQTKNPKKNSTHQKYGQHDMNLKLIKGNGEDKSTGTNFNGFSFFLMGDTPYRDWQVTRLEQQMKEMKEFVNQHQQSHNVSFTVHVGDIQKIDLTQCDESAYKLASDILKSGPVPTFVLPGDNDYYKCPNRTASFELFMKYFESFERHWHKADWERLNVVRSPDHRELFVFVVEGVLFIAVHLINAPRDEEPIELWNQRMTMNIEWVSTNVEKFMKSHEIRGVILLGHALRSPRTRPFFLSVADHFVNTTHRRNIPVLYLHGDGHDWDVDKKLSHQLHWTHYRDIQVDQGGLADPVIVQIAPQIDGRTVGLKESHKMQHTFGRGLFLLDQQRGLYNDPKNMRGDDATGKD
jgi:hypothetical protein